MRSSEKLDQLLPALAKARVNFGEIKKTQLNPHFGKKYADLSDILPQIVVPLADEGLVLLGTMEAMTSGEVEVTQRLMHVSEQYLESVTILSYPTGQLQKLGGDVSYFRRYAINTMLALSADEDLDDTLQDEPAKPARKPGARQPEPRQTPPTVTPPVKPTKDELTKGLQRMQEVYGDAAVVTGLIRAVVQPAGEVWTDFRVRNNIPAAAWQQLMSDTEQEAQRVAAEMNGNAPDDDVPLAPGPKSPDVPVEQTSPEGEQGDSSATGETHQEAGSVDTGSWEGVPAVDIAADELPGVDVDADGFVSLDAMAALKARAEQSGQRLLLMKILEDAERITVGQFRYAWVQVRPKPEKVTS